MAIADDFSVAIDGNIRYTGTTTNYTVIELHRHFGTLMDDAEASGDDLLDITSATASERATDNLITLNAPYNIDDIAAQHLYDGSIVQDDGDEIYDGIVCFAPASTPLQIIQNGKPLSPNFWDTALNADAGNGISHRFMVKTRTGGADINNRTILGQTREVGFTYSSFSINATSRGNNVLALTYAADLNNETVEATIRGWTTITNTEGFRELDVNNDTTDEPYYSEWNKAALTINQLYERTKWLSRESTTESSSADTGTDFQLANATVQGQAQSFLVGANNQYLTRMRFKMRKVGTPTGNITPTLKAHSGTFGTSSIPTGAALATGELFDIATLTTAYKTYELEFATPYEMVAATEYVITLEAAVIDGSNYVEIEGLAGSGTHAGNRSQDVSATWTPTAGDDLDHEAFASAVLYEMPGERFRGVTHELVVNTPTGTPWEAVEPVSWTGGTGQMLAINHVTTPTKMWIQLLTGVAPSGTLTITGGDSGATVDLNTTVTTRTLSEPFFGASTGSAMIGAYGVGVETADLTAADKLTDLDGNLRLPPNNVTFSVGGLVSGEDRILVGPLGYEFAWDNEGGTPPFVIGETLTFTAPSAGTAYLSELTDDGTTGRMKIRMLTGTVPVDDTDITGGTSGATADVDGAVVASQDPRQLKLATTLVGGGETAVVCVDPIPTDTPSAGTIRIQLDTGVYRLQAYLSYTGSTFTITSADYSGVLTATGGAAETGNSLFISYIDKLAASGTESFTGVYVADRSLFIRARDGGTAGDTIPIKTFESTGTLGSAGGSATAIRTSDA